MPSLIRRLPFAGCLFGGARPRAAEPAPPARSGAPPDIAAQLDARRGEAMRRLYPKLYLWWATRAEWGAALQVYGYLSEATSLDELEARILRVEQQPRLRQ